MRLCYSRKLTRARPCVFEKRYATALDLNLEDGEPLRMRSVNGAFVVYGHELTIRVLDIEHTAIVYFYADDNFGRTSLAAADGSTASASASSTMTANSISPPTTTSLHPHFLMMLHRKEWLLMLEALWSSPLFK